MAGQTPARVRAPIDENRLVHLARNTHPLARSEFDRGAAPDSLALDRMLLVLTPSPERQQALSTFLAAQQDKASTQYHKWLTPQQFGVQFGAADEDINKVTGWLASHGFQINRVSNGKNVIEFSGNAGQVRQAFHTEIHKYVVNGKAHWANSKDPEIPAALAGVVGGISTLYDFRKAPQITSVKPQLLGTDTAHSAFNSSNGNHALTPSDFVTIYRGWFPSAFVDRGFRPTIAVVARTNISLQDIADFRRILTLDGSATTTEIIINGKNPGDLGGDDEVEAVLDTSWAGATDPSVDIKLVVSGSTNTTDGVDLSEQYIVDHNLGDVMTESYGECEAAFTQAKAQFYLSLAEQAAAQGITYTVAAGDSGAEGCDDPHSEDVARGPLSVNLLASTPYDTAVGGTQFNEHGSDAAYWDSWTLPDEVGSAFSYIPEEAWNESCTVAACGSNAGLWAGGGGASTFFPKPAWQAGISGIPNDGARDIPDVALSSAGHDPYLICLRGSCSSAQISFVGVGGTSAATPAFAGIMALVASNAVSRQGLANPRLYGLAAGQRLSSCNASYPAAPPDFFSCIFNDVTIGNNAVPGGVGYGTGSAAYQAGVGYDLATGLGSVKIGNLAGYWDSGSSGTPGVRGGIDSPPVNSSISGLTIFSGWALAANLSLPPITVMVTSVDISIDSVPYQNATYGLQRTDICNLYPSANCPNIGWSFLFDSTTLPNGTHTLATTVTTSTGEVYTSSSNFTVANWSSANPMKAGIDSPNANSSAFSGAVDFGGWAIDSLSAISQVSVTIDGTPYGLVRYGGYRPDVCSAHPGEAACPYVGWDFTLDTTTLADGIHAVAITPVTAAGEASTFSASFTVNNHPANAITLSIDQPGTQSGPFSANAAFGGWAITTTIPISNIAVTIDGVPYGSATYGDVRSDVCKARGNRPGCPNVGWDFALDTTPLVNGMHVLGITAYAGAGQFSTAIRTFTVSNSTGASPLMIGIDSPSASNAIVLGQTTFSGWAMDLNGTINQVKIAVDGVVAGTATYGLTRGDVCAGYPGAAACPNIGWSFPVDTTRLANGVHTVTVTAMGARQNTLSAQFTVSNWTTGNPMKLSIDYPNSQAGPLSRQIGIGGWVIDQLAVISNIAIAVDNTPLGNAFYGGARPDACKQFAGAIGCPNVGWNYYLDTTLLGDGPHTLAVTGTTTGGQSSTFTQSFQVANSSTSPLRVNIDAPGTYQTITGISAPIGGWAVDTSGAQVLNVEILVDGLVNGTAIYGYPRADVCAHYPSAGGCPNVGWNYQLDTAPFANGTHTLEARVLAADGKKYTQSTTFLIANQP